MNDNQKYIELFKALIQHIDAKNGNSEFSSSLINSIQTSTIITNSDLNSEIITLLGDIKRTKYFLKNIDKNDWIEGFKYYDEIRFPELRMELVKDFKEMKIAERQNDLLEFGRHLSLQLENALNTIIEILDGHELVNRNPEKFKSRFYDLKNGNFSFFQYNKETRQIENKDVKNISFLSKVFFAETYYGFKVFWTPINEIVAIRNKASHRGKENEREIEIIKNATANFTLKKSEYFKEFDKIIKGLKDLYNADTPHR
jgi:hypothetical protein